MNHYELAGQYCVELGIDPTEEHIDEMLQNGSEEEWVDACNDDVIAVVTIRSRIGLPVFF